MLIRVQKNVLHIDAERTRSLSALIAPKLATDYYEFDVTRSHSPPLQPRYVNSKPSPDPIFLPPPASVPSPESDSNSPRLRGRKGRRRRTLPSRGDAVLIDHLGNQNHPHVAIIAGERPLDIDSGCSDEDMGEGDQDVVQIAQDASKLVDVNESSADELDGRHGLNVQVRPRPKIDTKALPSKADNFVDKADLQVKQEISYSNKQAFWGMKETKVAVERHITSRDDSTKPNDSILSQQSRLDSNLDAKSSATSSNLRQYAIPISEGSPMETLPAMQSSPPQSSKSPKGQQSLPSLHDQLGSLANARPLQENSGRPNGIVLQSLQQYPGANGSVHSSPKDLGLSRVSQFTTIQNRASGSYTHTYTMAQPSPASTLSEPSPREPHVKSQDPTSMSPPGRFGSHFINGLTPQSDVPTPKSAESCPSTSSFSTNTSPNGDRVNIEDGRPTLPPLPAGQIVSGGFKCDFAGCTALPFQTQYLLK